MKKLNKWISLLLCAVILVGLLPTGVWAVDDAKSVTITETTTTTKTVYVLTSSISSGNEYLIVNDNEPGACYALANNDGSVDETSVTVKSGNIDNDTANETYIELDDATDELWTTSGSSSTTLKNGNYYLRYEDQDVSLSTRESTNWTWSSNYNRLYRQGKSSAYYLRYSNGWGVSTIGNSVYFYAPTEIEVESEGEVTYSVSADDIDYTYLETGSYEKKITKSIMPTDGTYSTGGTYRYEIISDDDDIINGDIASDGTITFSGNEGKAKVRVYYTFTKDGVAYTIWDTITVTAKKPTYALYIYEGDSIAPGSTMVKRNTSLNLSKTTVYRINADGSYEAVENASITWSAVHEKTGSLDISEINSFNCGTVDGTITVTASYTLGDKTYTDTLIVEVAQYIYTLDLCEPVTTTNTDGTTTTTYESITKPIMIKEVVAGKTTSVWAVVEKDGEDQGELGNQLTWYSSDPTIATVDPVTGVVTFTGSEGLVTITASFEYADGKAVTDSVVFSASKGTYIVPGDGTDDFPAYPNQGSVRFDKTTTPVGSFNQTGTTMVELSMTGVPITTNNAMDVVVMLDMTGSMSGNGMEAAEEATKAFVELIVKNEDGTYNDNRVAVYAFNSGSSSPYELVSLGTIKSDSALSTANDAIDTASDKQASGGTPFDEAAAKCQEVLNAAKTTNLPDGVENAYDYDRQQFCVFMSDGGPTSYEGSDGYTYYGGNNGSGDRALTSYIGGYTSSDSSDWTYNLPTEYYTDQMKAAGVTVYTVGLLLQNAPSNPAPYSSMTDSTYDSDTDTLTTIGSHYYFTSSILKSMATDESKYIDIFNVDNADDATAKFQAIAQSILEAAKDVVVTDKMGSHFTMVFEPPNATVGEADGNQQYYIEVVDYALNPVYTDGVLTDYVRGTATSKLKLYMGTTGNTYYAATAAGSTNGNNKFATPVFETKPLGTSNKYYWTTDSSKSDCGISVTVNGTAYYFTSKGDGTHNMTSGAYANGTLTNERIINVDEHGNPTGEEEVNTVCNDLIIATPYFVYNAVTKTLVWTMDKVSSSELALRYFLYLDKSAGWEEAAQKMEAGTYSTNEYADFTYTNFQDNQVQQDFPAPQVTWNGAQVSYVFYLVNEKGQPVNRTGRVVPFSEAVYVTDVYTQSVVWNSLERVASLEADIIAQELLPSVYQLYDAGAKYSIHVFENENGQNLNNHFILEGSRTPNTTYVFNTKSGDRYSVPGAYAATESYKCKVYIEDATVSGNTITLPDTINVTNQVRFKEKPTGADLTVEIDGYWYAYYIDEHNKVYTIAQMNNATTVATGFDFANTTVAFAVVWKPQLVEDTVVIDYGLEVSIDVTSNDLSTGKAIGLRTDEPADVEINNGTTDLIDYKTEIQVKLGNNLEIGTATISGNNVAFALNKQNGMQLTEPIKFYYVYEVQYYQGENLVTKYMYSSVTIIPATTVYYEENFIQFDAAGTKITYTTTDENGVETEHTSTSRGWGSVGAVTGTWQDTDRPGNDILSGADANNLYGYDSHYLNCDTYSNGAAQMVTVDKDTFATATFTFTGTGFDLIGVTSNTTGTVIAEITDENGAFVRRIFVDTYYGSTYTETTKQAVDENGNPKEDESGNPIMETVKKWGPKEGAEGTLYQVPIITARELTYGKYTVTITVSYNEEYDHDNGTSYDMYLDAVRIYDPAGVVSGAKTNQTVMGAYVADNEWSPNFEEIRNVLLTFYGSGSMADGATIQNFIDGNPVNTSIEDYKNYGPNNELYLGYEQKLVIDVDDTFVNNQNVADIQIGLKSANDKNLQVKIYNLVNGNENNVKVISINTASDLFYSILDHYTGIVVIENITDGTVLSITNVKSTLKQTASQSIQNNTNAGRDEILLADKEAQESGVVWTTLARFYIDIVIAVAGVFSDIEAILYAVYTVATAVI